MTDSSRSGPALALLLLVALALNWLPGLDERAHDYVRGATVDSLAIFAAAKGLNAAISVAQSFEVGVGVSVAPFEFLDPLNDLVERFSGFIMYGLTALGLQMLLLTATSALWLKLFFSLALLIALVSLWQRAVIPGPLARLLLMLLLLRFALVLEVGVSWILDELYFSDRQEQAVTTLDRSSEQVLNARQRYLETRETGSWWQGVKSAFSFDISAAEQSAVGQQTTTAVVDLIVIMLVRSILLPLAVLWLLVKSLALVYGHRRHA